MNNDKVSVIIPCYNAEKYITSTVSSVLKQTHKNIEIIIIDDHSKDNSYELAKKLEKNTPTLIKVFLNEAKGACAARNYGFKKSKGEYIQFLDADDILSHDKIEMQVQRLQKAGNKLALCETWHFTSTTDDAINTDKKYLFSTEYPEEFFIRLWGGKSLEPNMVQTSAWLTPRTLINTYGLWNTSLSKDQDGEFFARIALNSDGIVYVDKIRNYYRKHLSGNNIASKKQQQHIASNLLATSLKEQYLFSKTQSTEAKLAIATQYKHVAIEAWPNYKEISKKALTRCKQLGGSSYQPVLGGRIIEVIKKVFGWRMAKAFSFYLHKII